MPEHSQALTTDGPCIVVRISVPDALAQKLQSEGKPIPTPVEGLALIDTGATSSCVNYEVLKLLGLEPVGRIPVSGAAGIALHTTYPARLDFPTLSLSSTFNQIIGVRLSRPNISVLLGRDLLDRVIFTYDGPKRKLTIST